MEKILSLSEKLLYTTVRIECLEGNQVISTGTGFFFNFLTEENGDAIPAIVTNKHVVEGAQKGRFYFGLSDSENMPTNQKFECNISNFENSWIMHPEEDVDLCIYPVGHIIGDILNRGLRPAHTVIDKEWVPSGETLDNLDALEDILMIGYPNGLWDSTNNLPILRKGITATHPNRDYNGAKEFMIDAACYPGSSGSPVLLYNPAGQYSDKRGNVIIGTPRLLLLGILYAGPQFTAQGDIHVVNIPTINKQVVLSHIPNNLGIVIKSEKLFDFEPILNEIIAKFSQS